MARVFMKRETGVVFFGVLPTRLIALGAIALSVSTAVVSTTASADGFPYRIPGEDEGSSLNGNRAHSPAHASIDSRAQLASISPSEKSDGSQNVAGEERREAARAHYERARTMLLESLAEFEAARGIARPDRLIDSEQWRTNVLSRVSELERVIDPAPRVVESAAVVRAEPSLLREEASGGTSAGVHAKLAITSAKAKSSALPQSKSVSKAPSKSAAQAKRAELQSRDNEQTAKLATKAEPLKSEKQSSKPAEVEEKSARKVDPMIPAPAVEKSDLAKSDSTQDDVLDDLVSESEKSAPEPKSEPVVAAKAEERRIDPLTEEEIKVRLKKLAADIEARDSSAEAGAAVGGQLAVDPTAKN